MKQITYFLALLLLSAALLSGCLGSGQSYLSVLNSNWALSLPVKGVFTEIYAKDSGASFHGDGLRYHIFSGSDPDQTASLLPWLLNPTTQATIYHPTLEKAAEAWLDALDIPESERPDYAVCQSWYAAQPDNSELLVFWDRELQRIYFVESFL